MTRARLEDSAITRWLTAHPDWAQQDGKLHKVYTFVDFVAAFAWMTDVAEVAEEMNHHPEWLNVYRTVTVWLQTHDAGGVTALDLQLGEAMDARVKTPRRGD
jgi:4a-hydroxytetrahydrobiopterin dehydratase